MSNFYLCGCGPYTTGIRNTKRDLDARAYDEKAEIAAQAAKAAAIKLVYGLLCYCIHCSLNCIQSQA